MPEEFTPHDIIKRRDDLKANRSNFDNDFQDIRDFVRLNTQEFTYTNAQQGLSKSQKKYDSTPIRALDRFGSGVYSYQTSQSDRWFNVTCHHPKLLQRNDVLMWLEEVSDRIYYMYSLPQVKFSATQHTGLLDIGSFGTCVKFLMPDHVNKIVRFRLFPLADCFIAENQYGEVDTCYRNITWTTRQAIQEFGRDALPDAIKNCKDLDQEWKFIHAVFPRTDRTSNNPINTNKPVASYWVNEDKKVFVRKSGFNFFPYIVSRWTKFTGESYGRSPAMNCLPEILCLNAFRKLILRYGQKVVDPPILLPNDGYMKPFKTLPGFLIRYEPGTEEAKPFPMAGDLKVADWMLEGLREEIWRAFYNDLFSLQKEKMEMRQIEVLERREDQVKEIGPMLGNLESEDLGPTITNTYIAMKQMGMIPPPPDVLKGMPLKIEYVSPAARAQQAGKAFSIQRFVEDLAKLQPLAPEVMDALDTDKLAQMLARLRDVSRTVLRQPRDIEAIRQARAEQAQMAQMLEGGMQAASAMRDIAKAQSDSPALFS